MSWEGEKITCTIDQKQRLFPNLLWPRACFQVVFSTCHSALGRRLGSAPQAAVREDGVTVPEPPTLLKHCFSLVTKNEDLSNDLKYAVIAL